MTKPITMIEIFSGIGAQAKALDQLPIPHEVVATMDVDKDAILSYASMRYDLEKEMESYNFPSKEQMVSELQSKNVGFDFQKNKHTITMKTNENKVKQYYIADELSKNLGDVSLQKELPYVDIIVHSSPCQAFSQAGKGEGGDEGSGTTSSLMWESLRLIESSKPQYVLWENVAAVLSGKHRHNFIKYLERMSELGYENAFDLLNGKHFGVPQNRLRIFCVSRKIDADDNAIRNIDNMPKSSNKQVENTMKEIKDNPNVRMWVDYVFPETIPLTTRLKDMLEKNVDEKYYLPDERVEKIFNTTLMKEKQQTQTFNQEPEVNQIMNIMPTQTRANPNQGRVYDVNGLAPTLTKMDGGNREPFIIDETAEPFIVASRGRNVDNPSDRTAGIPTEQRLEPNFSGCTNTLTSVQKDNYVVEPIVCEERKDEGIRLFKDDCVGTLRTIDACGDKRVIEPELMIEDVVFPVMVRKYPVDCDLLCECLRNHKNNSNLSNKNIADSLNIPLTKVEHWFRQDECFAIPDPDVWFKLKELLNITTNEFDESIMTFEIKDGVYDKANRCYHIDGIAPTLTAASANEKIIEPQLEFVGGIGDKDWVKDGKQLSRNYPQGSRVYSSDGIASALTAQGVGGAGGFSGLYTVEDRIRWRIRKLLPVECWKLMAFTKEDHDRAAVYVSNSALYKQSGNSIIVNVLVALMSSLFIEDGHRAEVWTQYMLNPND